MALDVRQCEACLPIGLETLQLCLPHPELTVLTSAAQNYLKFRICASYRMLGVVLKFDALPEIFSVISSSACKMAADERVHKKAHFGPVSVSVAAPSHEPEAVPEPPWQPLD